MPKVYYSTRGEKRNESKVRNHQETINKRFKDSAILDQQLCHDIKLHSNIFAAIAILSGQIAIQHNGEELFQVE